MLSWGPIMVSSISFVVLFEGDDLICGTILLIHRIGDRRSFDYL